MNILRREQNAPQMFTEPSLVFQMKFRMEFCAQSCPWLRWCPITTVRLLFFSNCQRRCQLQPPLLRPLCFNFCLEYLRRLPLNAKNSNQRKMGVQEYHKSHAGRNKGSDLDWTHEPTERKRLWSQPLAACIAVHCEGFLGADKNRCALHRCHAVAKKGGREERSLAQIANVSVQQKFKPFFSEV